MTDISMVELHLGVLMKPNLAEVVLKSIESLF